MFLGREYELDYLQQHYEDPGFQFLVIYGRRRVGKTALITEFSKSKPSVYFQATENTSEVNLSDLSSVINMTLFNGAQGAVYGSYQNAFEQVFSWTEQEKLLVILDEYPFLARSEPSIPSLLQRFIDQNKETSNVMLILCGSSLSFMEDQVLAYKSPLYGRRTGQMKIQPMDFFASRQFMPGFSAIDQAKIYGMTGGIPLYLLMFNSSLPLESNIERLYLDAGGFLYDEALQLLKQEVREPAIYNSLLTYLSEGVTKKSKLADKTNRAVNTITFYLDGLMELGIVEREKPAYSDSDRKSIYKLADFLFRFAYRYIYSNASAISKQLGDVVLEEIDEDYSSYMGFVFEEICRQYLWHQRREGVFHVPFREIRRWWGGDPRTHTQEEIDLVGEGRHSALVAECKWKNELTDVDVLETLQRRAALLPQPAKAFVLFSKSGFTDRCRQEAAQAENVWLITFEEMIQNMEMKEPS